MKWYRGARGLKVLLFATLAVAVFSFAVMSLWNWLMPAIFGTNPITFWQAVGLLLLSRILFGRFGERQTRADPRIVHEDVDPAEVADHGGDERAELIDR